MLCTDFMVPVGLHWFSMGFSMAMFKEEGRVFLYKF